MAQTSAVTFERHGDSFIIAWPDKKIGFGIERLKDHDWGGLYGYLTAYAITADTRGTLYGPVKVGLEDSRSQEQLSKMLHVRVNGRGEDEWLTLLITACNRVTQDWRKSSKTLNLAEVDISQASHTKYLIDGLIPKGETTIIFGDGESAKSLLAMYLGTCNRMGYAPAWGGKAPQVGKVLYLDWETNSRTMASRLYRIAQGIGIQRPDIGYRGDAGDDRPPLRSLPDEISSIREEISRERIDTVIIDSIGFALTGSLTDDDTARQALGLLRAMAPATRIVVAHVNSDTARNPNVFGRPFGSVFFWNGMRSGIEVRRSKDDQLEGQLDIGIYHRKSNDGWHHKPISLQVNFDGLDGPICFDPQDLSSVPELEMGTPLSSRIRQLLKTGSHQLSEVCEELDIEEKEARSTLRKMRDVIKLTPGTVKDPSWGLVEEHTA